MAKSILLSLAFVYTVLAQPQNGLQGPPGQAPNGINGVPGNGQGAPNNGIVTPAPFVLPTFPTFPTLPPLLLNLPTLPPLPTFAPLPAVAPIPPNNVLFGGPANPGPQSEPPSPPNPRSPPVPLPGPNVPGVFVAKQNPLFPPFPSLFPTTVPPPTLLPPLPTIPPLFPTTTLFPPLPTLFPTQKPTLLPPLINPFAITTTVRPTILPGIPFPQKRIDPNQARAYISTHPLRARDETIETDPRQPKEEELD
ncbi:unnamed protein product [Bursaphelenchus xylophilus]|uniref:(pine wood nematode) hypothetical protein n=1 Tax=Bursaphelenchus xylophilus TaxID=6326 RepID=A0A1I7RHZ8_BURXY|nr:unnamed protein product [Bursaphelenchus xylophilus]CAG9115261.1 unnamed protein product [Bursaphelenchus xylophilus]